LLRPWLSWLSASRQDPEAFEKQQWLATVGVERSGASFAYKQRNSIKTASAIDDSNDNDR